MDDNHKKTGQEYPVERALDGVYFRVKREGHCRDICFSDLTAEEREEVIRDRTIEWIKSLAFRLADVIRQIGDQFDITAKIQEEEENENV